MQYGSSNKRWIIMFAFLVLTILVSTVRTDKVLMEAPSVITPCKLHDPDNGPCITDIFQNVFSKLHGGIPGFKRVPHLDPLKVKKVQVNASNPLAVIDLVMVNIVGTGLAQATLTDGSVANGGDFKVNVHVPKFTMKGDYKMKGMLSILNIDGKGPYELVMSDVNFIVRFKTKIVQRSGEYFLDTISLKTDIGDIGEIHIQFNELFADNPELTEGTNGIFNQNREALLGLMRPVTQQTMDAFLLNYKKKLFSTVPARFLFTDLP